MNKHIYNLEIILLTVLLILSLTITAYGVVFREIKQPEVKVVGRIGLPITIPEAVEQPEEEPEEETSEVVVTEKPVQASKPVVEPVEEKPVQETETSQRGTKVALTLSHYTDSAEENGGYAGLDAMGNKLKWGTLASNNFSKGTQIYIEHYEHVFTVSDVGSSKYLRKLEDGSIKVDVFIPRRDGESRTDYRQRVLNLGIIKTYGYLQ